MSAIAEKISFLARQASIFSEPSVAAYRSEVESCARGSGKKGLNISFLDDRTEDAGL